MDRTEKLKFLNLKYNYDHSELPDNILNLIYDKELDLCNKYYDDLLQYFNLNIGLDDFLFHLGTLYLIYYVVKL